MADINSNNTKQDEMFEAIRYQALIQAVKFYAEEGDILNWGRMLFPEKFKLAFCDDVHGHFVETAEEEFTSTLAPRGTAKTTISCFLIPMFYALNYPDLYYHYLNVQSTATKAIEVNIGIKTELETNQPLIDIYGNQIGEKWTEKRFCLKNGVVFSCSGGGESMRGIQHKNRRPDYIIVDDMYDDDCINNAKAVEKINNWFWSTLYPARAKSKNHSIHIQGTAISKIDLMNLDPDTKIFKILKSDGSSLWPQLWTIEEINAEKKKIGSIIFSREYMNEVRDDESAIIKQSWIKYYKHSEFMQSGKKVKRIIAGLDPACTEEQLNNNDFSGYATIHLTDTYDIYIECCAEEKNSFNSNMNMIDNWHKRFNPHVFAIEAISGFKQLTDEVRRTKKVRLKEVKAVRDKISRLEAQSFRWENGKVYINSEMPAKVLNTLVDQLINNFPPHDDVRDAVIIAMEQIDKQAGLKVRVM